MNNKEIINRLNEVSEMLCLELGLDAIQIFAVSESTDTGEYTTFQAGDGLFVARIQLAREFVQTQDTYNKKNAWDSSNTNDESLPQ
jgi:hypothetical protein